MISAIGLLNLSVVNMVNENPDVSLWLLEHMKEFEDYEGDVLSLAIDFPVDLKTIKFMIENGVKITEDNLRLAEELSGDMAGKEVLKYLKKKKNAGKVGKGGLPRGLSKISTKQLKKETLDRLNLLQARGYCYEIDMTSLA